MCHTLYKNIIKKYFVNNVFYLLSNTYQPGDREGNADVILKLVHNRNNACFDSSLGIHAIERILA